MAWLLFIFCLSLQTLEFAAADPAVDPDTNPKWLAGISEELPHLGFSFRDSTSGAETVFKPMTKAAVGVKVGHGPYRTHIFTASPKNKGKHLDLLFGYNGKAWGGDSFYRTYQGFEGRADTRSEFYGGALYRSVNPESYPLDAISHLDWKGESRGAGFLIMGNASHLEIKGDRPLLPSSGFQTAEMFAVTAGPGAGGYMTGDHFLVNGNLSFGVGPQRQKVGYAPSAKSPYTDTRIGMVYQWTCNVAAAYQWKSAVAGANLKLNILKAYLGDTQLKTTGFSTEAFVALRF